MLRDQLFISGKVDIRAFVVTFSIVIALRWVQKPLKWTKKTVSFKIISSWCQLKSHVTSY